MTALLPQHPASGRMAEPLLGLARVEAQRICPIVTDVAPGRSGRLAWLLSASDIGRVRIRPWES